MSPRRSGPLAHVWRSLEGCLVQVARAVWVVVLAVLLLAAPAHARPDWDEAQTVRLVGDVDMPTDIDGAADGSLWFTGIEGGVFRYDPESKEVETVYEVEDVVTGGERGLVGLALSRDHEETGAFYLYYSMRTDDPDGGENRVVRVENGEERVLVSLPAALEHNGGRIVVAEDGTLFVGTGENSEHEPAQDLDSLLGKVLRMTPEGEPVDGNVKGLVYSYGHRNVYGLALDPGSGELWATENMGWRRDEVNRVKAGGNYGYPECEGAHLHGVDEECPRDKGYVFPVVTFYEDRPSAPTGATFLDGDLYWGSFNEGAVQRLHEDPETGNWTHGTVLDHSAPVLDVYHEEGGAFYLSATNGLWRVVLPGLDDGMGPDGAEDGEDGDGSKPEGRVPAPTVWVAVLMVLLLVPWARPR